MTSEKLEPFTYDYNFDNWESYADCLKREGIQVIPSRELPTVLAQRTHALGGEAFSVIRGSAGSNGETLDEALIPNVETSIYVSSEKYQELKGHMERSAEDGTLSAQICVTNSGAAGLGLLLYLRALDGTVSMPAYLPRESFKISDNLNFSDLLKPETRQALFTNQAGPIEDAELADVIRSSGNKTRVKTSRFGFKSVWAIADSVRINHLTTATPNKPEGSNHISRYAKRVMIDPTFNRFNNGNAYATIHTHPSVEYDSAEQQVKQMIDELREPYFRFMSPSDVITMLNSEDNAVELGLEGLEEQVGGVFSTSADFSQIGGISILDWREVFSIDDGSSAQKLADCAYAAEKSGTYEDYFEFFDLYRKLCFDHMPDYLGK